MLTFKVAQRVVSIGMLVISLLASATVTVAAEEESEEVRRQRLHLYLKGRYVFQKQCAICHGATGRGDGEWAGNLIHKPRNFRAGIFKFRTTPYGMLPTTEDLHRTIRSGISGTAMPFFKDLSEEDLSSLIVYIQSLSREWDDESLQAEPLMFPDTPQWFASAEDKKREAGKAKQRFVQSCMICHGEKGEGDGPGGKGLMDVWGFPSKPANLSEEHHKSGDGPQDLYRTIATGLNGTAMIGFAEQFKPAEIWQLVAYVQGLSEGLEAKK
tara:strand:+ start:581 stop:1387 length:807 start_codon:yes stop_codon:yes gene_type:complete